MKDDAPLLSYRSVSRVFSRRGRDGGTQALDSVSLDVQPGQIVAIVGPSGCGKSTLLNMAAGLDQPTSGAVSFLGEPVRGPSPQRAVCFQDYALFPWLTAADNVAFGLRATGVPARDRDNRVRELLQMVGLNRFADRYPHELSGGMRQRCAVARTLAVRPRLLLMDEPFAAVDPQTRNLLQEDFLRLWERLQAGGDERAALFITHSVEEAVFLADRVAVMTASPGTIQVEVTLDLPKPRTDNLRGTKAFQDLAWSIWQRLRREIRPSAGVEEAGT